jgi:hypothetical protein
MSQEDKVQELINAAISDYLSALKLLGSAEALVNEDLDEQLQPLIDSSRESAQKAIALLGSGSAYYRQNIPSVAERYLNQVIDLQKENFSSVLANISGLDQADLVNSRAIGQAVSLDGGFDLAKLAQIAEALGKLFALLDAEEKTAAMAVLSLAQKQIQLSETLLGLEKIETHLYYPRLFQEKGEYERIILFKNYLHEFALQVMLRATSYALPSS